MSKPESPGKYAQPGETPPQDLNEIRRAIHKKYAEVSRSAAGKFQYPTGKEGASELGYDHVFVETAFPRLLESFCGVGNPFSLGEINPGEAVLDFGCGAGFDLYVSSRLVGESGRVCGIDLTADMVEKAEENLTQAGIANFEVKHVHSETIPYDDDSFDVVISNGVINLSPCKQECFKEIYRVLKPDGRFQFADVMLEKELPPSMSRSAEAWSQ